MTLEEETIHKLIEKGLTFGSAESLTGGLFAATATSVPGVSKTFKGGIVSYATSVKEEVLGVSDEITIKEGAVSASCAKAMAFGAKKVLATDIAVSFTGNAGPDVMEGKPVGLVYLGIAYGDQLEAKELHLSGSREEIRKQCVEIGFREILSKIS